MIYLLAAVVTGALAYLAERRGLPCVFLYLLTFLLAMAGAVS